jgi:hypothetical protein
MTTKNTETDFKPRVLKDYNAHIGIEIKRGRKWVDIVTKEADGLKRTKMLINQVDRYWKDFDYDIKKAIEKFLAPNALSNQTEDTSITDDLKELLKGL